MSDPEDIKRSPLYGKSYADIIRAAERLRAKTAGETEERMERKDPWYAYGARVTDGKLFNAWVKWNEAHPDTDETTRALWKALFDYIGNRTDPRNFG